MAIEISCACGQRLTVDANYAGKRVRCPACKGAVDVPDEELVEAEVLDDDEEADFEAARSAPAGFTDAGGAEMQATEATRAVAGELGAIKLREPARCVAYCPSNLWAAAGIDEDIQILDMKNHKRAFKFKRHEDAVTSVCFSPDKRRILSGDEVGGLLLWDRDRRKTVRWLKGHGRAVSALAFSPNGRYAVSGGEDGRIRLWDVDTGDECQLDDADWNTTVRCVSFSPDGRLIAACGGKGYVDLWRVKTGAPLKKLSGASGTVTSLSFSRAGDYLTACTVGQMSGKCKVWQWQVPEGAPLNCWENPDRYDCLVVLDAVVPGGNYIVSIGKIVEPDENEHASAAAEALEGWKELFSGVSDYRFQVRNVRTGQQVRDFRFHAARPTCLAPAPNGSRALSATAAGKLHVWGLGEM